MAVNEEYVAFIKDQMSELDSFVTKRMFGGVGFFREGIMFGMIGDGKFRLRVDDKNRANFEAYEMEPYLSGKKGKSMPYYEVPIEIIEDRHTLAQWANTAFEVAKENKKK